MRYDQFMFVCELCGTLVPPRMKANQVVTETRARNYPARQNAQKIKRKKKPLYREDPGGRGWEIVTEANACQPCAAKHETPVPARQEV